MNLLLPDGPAFDVTQSQGSGNTAVLPQQPTTTQLANGGYVVAWIKDTGNGDGTTSHVITAQRYDNGGTKVGGEIAISASSTLPINGWSIAGLADSSFAVTWSQAAAEPIAPNYEEIYARVIGADGVPLGPQFLANTTIPLPQDSPDVFALSGGGFGITWHDTIAFHSTTDVIKAQLFTATGAKSGGEITVGGGGSNYQSAPEGTQLSNGNFLVVWRDSTQEVPGDPFSTTTFHGRVFASNGATVGNEFTLSAPASGLEPLQIAPLPSSSVVAGGSGGPLPTGGFLAYQANSGNGIQMYDVAGQAVGTPFAVAGTQVSVSVLHDGAFMVGWRGTAAGTTETYHVQMGDYNGTFGSVFDIDPRSLNPAVYAFADLHVTGLADDDTVATWRTELATGESTVVSQLIDGPILGTRASDTFNGTDSAERYVGLKGNDTILGGGGDDLLYGRAGADILDGGSGNDEMHGGLDDDVYAVYSPGDQVFENPGEGTDTIRTSVSYVLPANVENLTLFDGAGDISGTGNELNNVMHGNEGANVLRGGDGLDQLYGGDGNDTLYGDAGNDALYGNPGNDLLFAGSGRDLLYGGAGNDGFYLGAYFVGPVAGGDFIDGEPGFDQLGLQGDYSTKVFMNQVYSVEEVVLLPGDDTRFGDTAGNHYSYNIAATEANVGAGQYMYINWNTLRVGENVTFDGSAESNGKFITYAGHGIDTVIGGQQNDGFYFGYGMWGPSDSVVGQGGTLDQLGLQGNYTAAGTGAIVFGATQLTGIEMIVPLSGNDTRFGSPPGVGYSYDLTMNDANVAAGATMYISANTLLAAGGTLTSDERLIFHGQAETNGIFVVYAGAGADDITGGAGGDTIYGEGGADLLRGGAGNDSFNYLSASDSTASAMDQLLDFSTGDVINLHPGNGGSFTYIGSGPFTHTPAQLRAYQQSPGHWQVEGDTNGDGVADLVIAVTTDHALTASDFVL